MDRAELCRSRFGVRRPLVGVLHVEALPGTPRHRLPLAEIVERAVGEARTLAEAGFHALILENMHDRPYLAGAVGPEIVGAMTAVGREVRSAVALPLGIQILAAANREALATALACEADFVRVEGYVFGHVADEGWIESSAAELLRYRRALGAERILVFADVKKKHAAHAVTADVDLAETARAAELFLADGLIVTGTATGRSAAPGDLETVREAVGLPTWIGSGITADNLIRYPAADGWIVGSFLKRGGLWSNPVDRSRADALVEAWAELTDVS